MLLNEIMRRLQNSDPQVRYVVTFLYEAFNEQQKQLNLMADVITEMAKLSEHTTREARELKSSLTQRVHDLEHFGETAGVSVSSVARDPSDD